MDLFLSLASRDPDQAEEEAAAAAAIIPRTVGTGNTRGGRCDTLERLSRLWCFHEDEQMTALHDSMEMSRGKTGTKSEERPYQLKGDESRLGIHLTKTLHSLGVQNKGTQQ